MKKRESKKMIQYKHSILSEWGQCNSRILQLPTLILLNRKKKKTISSTYGRKRYNSSSKRYTLFSPERIRKARLIFDLSLFPSIARTLLSNSVEATIF